MKIRKGKTPVLASLQEVSRLASFANQPHTPSADELLGMQREGYWSRRKFIDSLGKAGLSITTGSLFIHCKEDKIQPDEVKNPNRRNAKIAIVGAGIAGLNAAYQLRKQGVIAHIYEANATVGGRIRTAYNLLNPGLYAELGGEFINSDHSDMLNLAQELDVPLIDTAIDSLTKDLFWVDNAVYSVEECIQDFQKIVNIIIRDQSFLKVADDHPEFLRLDNQSLDTYLQHLPASDKLKKLLEGAYVTEFGLDAEEQSPIYALSTMGTDTSEGVQILGTSDQRYRMAGGNTTLIQRLATRMSSQIFPDHRLEAVWDTGSRYRLAFANGREVEADFVVLAVPLPLLKEIEWQISGMRDEKRRAIEELGMGQNAKLLMGFRAPIWRAAGYQGFLCGNAIHNGWDHTYAQDYDKGAGYTVYQGGSSALQLSRNSNDPQCEVDRYLPQIEKIFGRIGTYNGRNAIANWPDQPFVKGSYLCPKVGKYHLLKALAEPIGNLIFAGEHTSMNYYGYMNGGAESGRMAAKHILKRINKVVNLKARWHRRLSA